MYVYTEVRTYIHVRILTSWIVQCSILPQVGTLLSASLVVFCSQHTYVSPTHDCLIKYMSFHTPYIFCLNRSYCYCKFHSVAANQGWLLRIWGRLLLIYCAAITLSWACMHQFYYGWLALMFFLFGHTWIAHGEPLIGPLWKSNMHYYEYLLQELECRYNLCIQSHPLQDKTMIKCGSYFF